MCCILENYQTEEGVKVPACLQPFLGGKEFIPYNKKQVDLFFEKKAQEEKKKEEKKDKKEKK
jgi:seryl-tRNA synthetase